MRAGEPLRPLLKWAGGKRQLLPILRRFYPEKFSVYVEPFLGSGAVFFDLCRAGLTAGRQVRLADGNPDLIGCYRTVRDRPDQVIAALRALADGHRQAGTAFYYEVRDSRFNPARRAGEPYGPELAAMFIYLNRTGYNGLFRVNRRGEFNVPAGRYTHPRICNADQIHAVAGALRGPGVSLACEGFDISLSGLGEGSFVYCDPPYAPLSDTARFAHYTAGGFSSTDQERLQRRLVAAARHGATVVLSNSSAPLVERLYTVPAVKRAGLTLLHVPARRAINSHASARGAIREVIVSNATARLRVPSPRMARMTLPARQRRRA